MNHYLSRVFEDIRDIGLKRQVSSGVFGDKLPIDVDDGVVVDAAQPDDDSGSLPPWVDIELCGIPSPAHVISTTQSAVCKSSSPSMLIVSPDGGVGGDVVVARWDGHLQHIP